MEKLTKDLLKDLADTEKLIREHKKQHPYENLDVVQQLRYEQQVLISMLKEIKLAGL